MTTETAPRTCTRCGADYTVKPGQARYKAHAFGICRRCKGVKKIDPWPMRDYSTIPPIRDEEDDTRPVWQYRTPTGVAILMSDDLTAISRRMSDYFARRLGMRMDVLLDLDEDTQPTGRGTVVGPETGRIYARFRIERIAAAA